MPLLYLCMELQPPRVAAMTSFPSTKLTQKARFRWCGIVPLISMDLSLFKTAADGGNFRAVISKYNEELNLKG